MLDWSKYVNGDEFASIATVRRNWDVLEMRLRREGERTQAQDAYPVGYFAGVNLVVSEKFKYAVDRAFPDQCTFLPVDVDGINAGYFALWVNAVRDDVVDVQKSELTPYPGNSLAVRKVAFDETRLADLAIFRLSPKFIGTQDFVTTRFVEMARSAGLSGLHFWDRN
jgi:hypothetical protein